MRRFLSMLVVVALLAVVLRRFIRLRQRVRARMQAPKYNPRAFLQRGRQSTTQSVVVCAGDSLTHGFVSANYVEMLQERLANEDYEFINGGINGNLAYNVLQRLDEIIACQPNIVTLLIGTNDVNATLTPALEARYRKEQQIPQSPTLAWYRANVAQILDRLQAAGIAHIAVLSIPMLGEDFDSAINARINSYNAGLRELAAEKQVTYLPLHERLLAALPKNHIPPPYAGKVRFGVLLSILTKLILQYPWTTVSKQNGLYVLTDHIHVNETGAEIIAALIEEFLQTVRPKELSSA